MSGPLEKQTTQVAHLQIRACKDGACVEGILGSDTMLAGSNGARLGLTLANGDRFECAVIDFKNEYDRRWSFSLDYVPAPTTDLQAEGQGRYTLQIVDTDTQTKLIDIDRTVAYTKSRPNGPHCAPECTEGASLALPSGTPL
jgi:hypothetical protein